MSYKVVGDCDFDVVGVGYVVDCGWESQGVGSGEGDDVRGGSCLDAGLLWVSVLSPF